jgi:hypothetical protein
LTIKGLTSIKDTSTAITKVKAGIFNADNTYSTRRISKSGIWSTKDIYEQQKDKTWPILEKVAKVKNQILASSPVYNSVTAEKCAAAVKLTENVFCFVYATSDTAISYQVFSIENGLSLIDKDGIITSESTGSITTLSEGAARVSEISSAFDPVSNRILVCITYGYGTGGGISGGAQVMSSKSAAKIIIGKYTDSTKSVSWTVVDNLYDVTISSTPYNTDPSPSSTPTTTPINTTISTLAPTGTINTPISTPVTTLRSTQRVTSPTSTANRTTTLNTPVSTIYNTLQPTTPFTPINTLQSTLGSTLAPTTVPGDPVVANAPPSQIYSVNELERTAENTFIISTHGYVRTITLNSDSTYTANTAVSSSIIPNNGTTEVLKTAWDSISNEYVELAWDVPNSLGKISRYTVSGTSVTAQDTTTLSSTKMSSSIGNIANIGERKYIWNDYEELYQITHNGSSFSVSGSPLNLGTIGTDNFNTALVKDNNIESYIMGYFSNETTASYNKIVNYLYENSVSGGIESNSFSILDPEFSNNTAINYIDLLPFEDNVFIFIFEYSSAVYSSVLQLKSY